LPNSPLTVTKHDRTGWGGITADADTYIHTLSPYLSFYQDSGKRVATVGRSVDGARLESGVITFLCCGDETELVELHHALSSLATHYTKRYPYPVVIFHDMLTTSNETSLVAAYGSASPLSFERIDFAFPEDMPSSVREVIDSSQNPNSPVPWPCQQSTPIDPSDLPPNFEPPPRYKGPKPRGQGIPKKLHLAHTDPNPSTLNPKPQTP
jgi:hypothetical protein